MYLEQWRKIIFLTSLMLVFLLTPTYSSQAATTIDPKNATYINSPQELKGLPSWQIWKDPNSNRLYRVLAGTVQQAQTIKAKLNQAAKQPLNTAPIVINDNIGTLILNAEELSQVPPWQVWKNPNDNRLYRLNVKTELEAKTLKNDLSAGNYVAKKTISTAPKPVAADSLILKPQTPTTPIAAKPAVTTPTKSTTPDKTPTPAPTTKITPKIKPSPTIISLSPTNRKAGDFQFTLIVNGTNFVPGSNVKFNGFPVTTNFISPTTLSALIPASYITVAAKYTVTVAMPSGTESNSQVFTVVNNTAAPSQPAPTKPTPNPDCQATTKSLCPVTNLTASPSQFNGDINVLLEWADPSGNSYNYPTYAVYFSETPFTNDDLAISYAFFRGGDLATPLKAGTKRSFIIQGLKPSTTYYFDLKISDNTHGGAMSNIASTKTESPHNVGQNTTIAVVVDDKLATDSALTEKIDRYIQDIHKVKPNADVKKIAKTDYLNLSDNLKNLYFNNNLEGIVLIGWFKDLTINKQGYQSMNSIWPLVDFINPEYTYNASTAKFEWNGQSVTGIEPNHSGGALSSPEIWSGLIQPPLEGTEGIQLLKDYFDRDHAYYQGELRFSKKMFYTNLLSSNTPNLGNEIDATGRWHFNETKILKPKIAQTAYIEKDPDWTQSYLNELQSGDYEVFIYNGHGATDFHQYQIYNTDIKKSANNVLLYSLLSCNTANFSKNDYVAGWYLFTGHTLAVVGNTIETFAWVGNLDISAYPIPNSGLVREDFLIKFAKGETIGEAILHASGRGAQSVILGDPLVRLVK